MYKLHPSEYFTDIFWYSEYGVPKVGSLFNVVAHLKSSKVDSYFSFYHITLPHVIGLKAFIYKDSKGYVGDSESLASSAIKTTLLIDL